MDIKCVHNKQLNKNNTVSINGRNRKRSTMQTYFYLIYFLQTQNVTHKLINGMIKAMSYHSRKLSLLKLTYYSSTYYRNVALRLGNISI